MGYSQFKKEFVVTYRGISQSSMTGVMLDLRKSWSQGYICQQISHLLPGFCLHLWECSIPFSFKTLSFLFCFTWSNLVYLSIHILLVGIVLIYLLELPLTRANWGSDRYYSSGENRVALDKEITQVIGRDRKKEKSLRLISTMRR